MGRVVTSERLGCELDSTLARNAKDMGLILTLLFVCLLLFYTIATVFQLYHDGDVMY